MFNTKTSKINYICVDLMDNFITELEIINEEGNINTEKKVLLYVFFVVVV